MPATAAHPGCMRLVQAPSSRKTWTPEAVLAAMPWSATMASDGRIEQACGNDAGAEMSDDAGGMKAGVVEAALSGRADTDRGLHSRGVGHQ